MAEYSLRIKDKLKELEKLVVEFENIIPQYFQEYEKDNIIKAACERYFERVSESIFDICKLLIKNEGVTIKDNEAETLFSLKIIGVVFKDKLKRIKGMRNLIIHQYGEVDDELMFESIKNKLLKDTKEFIELVNEKQD